MSLPEEPLISSVWVTEEDVVYDGPFRTNVSAFLGHFGTRMHMESSSASCWIVRVQERAGDEHGTVELHVYEEPVQQDSPTVCDQCRIIGTYLTRHILFHSSHYADGKVLRPTS